VSSYLPFSPFPHINIRWFFSAALSLELPPTEVIRYHFLHELRLSSSNKLKAIARYPMRTYIKN
tara:strand:+ start:58 stop:249 length:192 start_codon:yes stop_codon:yes gene_type:complete